MYVHISKHCSKIFFRGWDVAQWQLIKLRQVSGSSLGQTQLLVTQKVEDNLNKKIMKLKNSSFKLIGRHVHCTVYSMLQTAIIYGYSWLPNSLNGLLISSLHSMSQADSCLFTFVVPFSMLHIFPALRQGLLFGDFSTWLKGDALSTIANMRCDK